MKTPLTLLATLATMAMSPQEASAHGGSYRQPNCSIGSPNSRNVPPASTGQGTSASPSNGPASPSSGSAAPTTSGSPTGSGPSTGPAGIGPSSGGGMSVGEDLTRWRFWWEFNKDSYIDVKSSGLAGRAVVGGDSFFMGAGKKVGARDSQRVTAAHAMTVIMPALKRALDATDQRDITSSCMVAMAKIGRDHPDFRILDVLRERLSSRDLEIRETAAIAMGISHQRESVVDLIHLATDSIAGRRLCDRAEVDDRTRSFACYGLGLVAANSSDPELKARILDALTDEILKHTGASSRNVRVAAINTIALLNPDDTRAGRTLLLKASNVLHDFWMRDVGPGEQLIQAHVPPAIAKLLESHDDLGLRAMFKDTFRSSLQAKPGSDRRISQITQSCAIALGRLTRPEDADAREISATLHTYYQNGKDQQTRYFCLIALAQIGGADNLETLLRALDRGKKVLEKPWAALALGVMARATLEAGGSPDPAIQERLRATFAVTRTPDTQAALAIALGLAGCKDAAPELRALLLRDQQKDELAGYLCIALALMDDQEALGPIRTLVQSSVRRPELLRQAAVALGKLGDFNVTEMLGKRLREGSTNLLSMSALASALGFIGDRRSVDPLVSMLLDEGLADLTRAFAAVALGDIADKDPLPWNSAIARDMNYRAAVETLTNQQSGILDIL